jgi:hypothetical protein
MKVSQHNFVQYSNIEKTNSNIVVYSELFTNDMLDKVRKKWDFTAGVACISAGLYQLTDKLLLWTESKVGTCACLALEDSTIETTNTITNKTKKFDVKYGSIILFGGLYRESHTYKLPKKCMCFYEACPLSYIYLTTKERDAYIIKISLLLWYVKKVPDWEQNLNYYLNLGKMIGSGCYGNVYEGSIEWQRFAVKLSKLKPEAMTEPEYNNYISSWHEALILRDCIQPILKKCPNLPLLYDTFTLKKCNLVIKEEKIVSPCVVTLVELANGDLKKYMLTKPPEEEVYSAIFQIMAGLYALQTTCQLMHYDVKKENILYYDVEKYGCWHYRIHGIDFYVPNYGKLFVISDFGISRTLTPEFPMYKTKEEKYFRLGHRIAILMDKKFVPINTEKYVNNKGSKEMGHLVSWSNGEKTLGGEFIMSKKGKIIDIPIELDKTVIKYAKENNIHINPKSRKFFLQPEIIPPFEFFNDTQDAIRMFVGGKRTTQKGDHGRCEMSKKLRKQLLLYINPSESMTDMIFDTDPAKVLAGFFIEDFFTKYTNYREKPNMPIIGSYILS